MVNLHNNSLYLLIICVLVITGSQPNNNILDISSATPTGGLNIKTPFMLSSTPSQTYTATVTASVTPSPTLDPLPAITLLFPAPTNTQIATVTPLQAIGTSTPLPTKDNVFLSASPRMKTLAIIIAILWFFLAGFLVIYIRQFK
jgi:hypothetical protein